MDKIKNLSLPGQYQLITLDISNVYFNRDQAKGLQAVREIITKCPLFDSIMGHLDISLKSKDCLFNSEWHTQNAFSPTDWA